MTTKTEVNLGGKYTLSQIANIRKIIANNFDHGECFDDYIQFHKEGDQSEKMPLYCSFSDMHEEVLDRIQTYLTSIRASYNIMYHEEPYCEENRVHIYDEEKDQKSQSEAIAYQSVNGSPVLYASEVKLMLESKDLESHLKNLATATEKCLPMFEIATSAREIIERQHIAIAETST